MECALRVVIIVVICAPISSAKSLLGDVQYQENQFSGIPSKILEAIKRYLILNPSSEDNLRHYWNVIDRAITAEHSSRLGGLHLHGEGEDQNVGTIFPAYLTVQNEKRDSTGRKSLQDDRITKEEGETTYIVML
jgi:hypothetical protein